MALNTEGLLINLLAPGVAIAVRARKKAAAKAALPAQAQPAPAFDPGMAAAQGEAAAATTDTVAGLGSIYSLRGLGVPPTQTPPTETTDESYDTAMTTIAVIGWTTSLVGTGAGAYHGFKRNNSLGWAIGWALLGGLFPVITLSVAAAQGFGKRAK